jgi:pilus assembly protein Flp/PilA
LHLSVCGHLPSTWNPLEAAVCRKQAEDQVIILKKFLRDQSGATAIEYGLIAAGISVAIIAVVQGLGSKLDTTFTSVKNALN